jgi:hypothetical protein
VLFTVLQLPDMSDEQLQQDLDAIRADLDKLRTVLEVQAGRAGQDQR